VALKWLIVLGADACSGVVTAETCPRKGDATSGTNGTRGLNRILKKGCKQGLLDPAQLPKGFRGENADPLKRGFLFSHVWSYLMDARTHVILSRSIPKGAYSGSRGFEPRGRSRSVERCA